MHYPTLASWVLLHHQLLAQWPSHVDSCHVRQVLSAAGSAAGAAVELLRPCYGHAVAIVLSSVATSTKLSNFRRPRTTGSAHDGAAPSRSAGSVSGAS